MRVSNPPDSKKAVNVEQAVSLGCCQSEQALEPDREPALEPPSAALGPVPDRALGPVLTGTPSRSRLFHLLIDLSRRPDT